MNTLGENRVLDLYPYKRDDQQPQSFHVGVLPPEKNP